MGSAQTAEILLEDPTVVETASDETSGDIGLHGTMFADGLNANYWGLTERGANRIAQSLEGADLTAGHPHAVGYGFTRSIHDGPGKPIGEVTSTGVEYFASAMMADVGGGYTASYEADVTNERYADDFRSGLMIGGDYGVSIGMTADEEDAECSVCGDQFASCPHRRGEEVDGQAAGPLFTDGEGDHLAVVYVPAWDEASADVTAAREADSAMMASTADEFFGQPFDNADSDTTQESDVVGTSSTAAETASELRFTLEL